MATLVLKFLYSVVGTKEQKLPICIARKPVQVDVVAGKTYWVCNCGLSKNQPFCDGSHKGTEFKPQRFDATESESKSFCMCKKTQKDNGLCDGSHRNDALDW